jgi:hypothetical protein
VVVRVHSTTNILSIPELVFHRTVFANLFLYRNPWLISAHNIISACLTSVPAVVGGERFYVLTHGTVGTTV